MKKKPKRGGDRNTGRKLPNNTSGLVGIWFQARLGAGADPKWHVYVCSVWADKEGTSKRTAYSVRRHSPVGALTLAISARVKVGLPVPSISKATKALKQFLKEHKNETTGPPDPDIDDGGGESEPSGDARAGSQPGDL